MQVLSQFLRCEDGTTAVEYAVMLAMILMSVIGAVTFFGQSQDAYWGKIDGDMKSHGF